MGVEGVTASAAGVGEGAGREPCGRGTGLARADYPRVINDLCPEASGPDRRTPYGSRT